MTSPSSTSKIRSGGCHCGEVRYELQGDVANATLCHCTLCRATTGAPVVAWCSVEAMNFRFTQGFPRNYRSTPRGMRTFCAKCGTQLTFREDGETCIDVTTASLDDPNAEAVSPETRPTREANFPGWVARMHCLTSAPQGNMNDERDSSSPTGIQLQSQCLARRKAVPRNDASGSASSGVPV